MDITDNDKVIAKSLVLERIELVLPSTLESVCRIEQAAEDLARRAAFNEEERGDIALVVREATINACTHGNRSPATRRSGSIWAEQPKGLFCGSRTKVTDSIRKTSPMSRIRPICCGLRVAVCS